MSGRRIFLMLEWDTQLGAAGELVGVLGFEEPASVVAEWIPWHPQTERWYERVRDGVDERRIAAWLREGATLALGEVPDLQPAADLRTAVAAALDAELAAPSAEGRR